MKIINPRVHGILDYVVVVGLLAAPTLLGLAGSPAVIAYLLAGVHLTLTLLTAFPMGALKAIPFKIHGLIEMIVGPCLVASPFVLGFSALPMAKDFYVICGAMIFLVWVLTDYKNS